MEIQDEIEKQKKELDKIEESYDRWEENLDETELLLFKYQDMIESMNLNDQSVEQLVKDLQDNYTELDKEVTDLENKYKYHNNGNRASFAQADEVLNLLRKLNTEIDNLSNSTYLKSVNSKISRIKLISDVVK